MHVDVRAVYSHATGLAITTTATAAGITAAPRVASGSWIPLTAATYTCVSDANNWQW
jgi:hypothetical protein